MEEDGPGAYVRHGQPRRRQGEQDPAKDLRPPRHPREGLLELGPQQLHLQDDRRGLPSPPGRRAGRKLTPDHLQILLHNNKPGRGKGKNE